MRESLEMTGVVQGSAPTAVGFDLGPEITFVAVQVHMHACHVRRNIT
jgi:hypothetical protein